VTVTGNNLDAAAEPIITVTVVVTEFNSTDDNNNITTAITSQTTTINIEVHCCDALCQYKEHHSTVLRRPLQKVVGATRILLAHIFRNSFCVGGLLPLYTAKMYSKSYQCVIMQVIKGALISV